ncbi:MAG: thiamine phosphate synthase [Brevundimonas sp.]|uniref:thiamine phosphate synthase n=1 Tax=Brevundimonas sp. TaxID=1871086 RepID=UPI0027348995|nr:thiamine phosphate synthase [Brevundimonas sp.]MDP3379302.1 thiamine phosphate synthase [Brevundimonas sp.]
MTGDPGENQLWQTAQALNRAAAAVSPGVASLPPLLFFTDPVRTPRPWEVAARLPRGAGVVYRGFGRPGMVEEARQLRRVTADRGVRLLIGQDIDLAEAVGADGVHLPERDLGRAKALRSRYPFWLITGALHGDAAVSGLEALDAVVLSPVFRAGGMSAVRDPLGVEVVTRYAGRAPLPVYGLGGITAETATALAGSGLCGLAAIEGVVTAFSAG